MNAIQIFTSAHSRPLLLALFTTMILISSQSFATSLDDRIPMPPASWGEVQGFMKQINRGYVPSPQIVFRYTQPQRMISEKTAVLTLESVRDSLETNSGFEPWVFQHIQMLCDHPACTGQ